MRPSGRHESMPTSEFERIVRAAATKSVSFHYEKEGALSGLPPDVLTVMFGVPDDGLWFNVRKGEIPEQPEFIIKQRPLSDYDKALLSGAIKRTHGRQRKSIEQMQKPVKRKKYEGWRPVLFTMLKKGLLRNTADLEEWMGYRDMDQAKPSSKIQKHEVSEPIREALRDSAVFPIPGVTDG